MDLRHFDLALLPALDCLLRERNVTRAAERMFVSQQALSATLQRLRVHFNDQLLLRVGRKFELTPLARSLVIPVRDAMLAAQAVLEARPSFDAATAEITCRIAMSDYALFVLLPHFLTHLEARAPQIQCIVEPVTNDSFRQLSMGDLDFCVLPSNVSLFGKHRPEKRIRSEIVFDDDFVCVFDPEKNAFQDGITIKEYRTLRHNLTMFGEGVSTIVEDAWTKNRGEYKASVIAPTFSALIFMVPGTSLVATTQRRLASTLAPRLGLSIAECPLKVPRLKESVMWHERSDLDPAHNFFKDALVHAADHLVNRTEQVKRLTTI